MKKKMMVALACAGCFMIPSCLSVDQDGLVDLGEGLLCNAATSGLPYSGHLDYCSAVDIDLSVDLDAEE